MMLSTWRSRPAAVLDEGCVSDIDDASGSWGELVSSELLSTGASVFAPTCLRSCSRDSRSSKSTLSEPNSPPDVACGLLVSVVDTVVVASETADKPSSESRARWVVRLRQLLELARALGVAAAQESGVALGLLLGVEAIGNSSTALLALDGRVGVAVADEGLAREPRPSAALESPLLGVEGDMMLAGKTVLVLVEAAPGLISSEVRSRSVALVSLVAASALVLWTLLAPELSNEMGGRMLKISPSCLGGP